MRHTGIKDVINVLIGVNILATVLLFETYLTRRFYIILEVDISGSIIYIHLLLNIFFLISAKFLIKSAYKEIISEIKPIRKAIIYGAGSSGIILYNSIQSDVKSNIDVIGFIDDDNRKIGNLLLIDIFAVIHSASQRPTELMLTSVQQVEHFLNYLGFETSCFHNR